MEELNIRISSHPHHISIREEEVPDALSSVAEKLLRENESLRELGGAAAIRSVEHLQFRVRNLKITERELKEAIDHPTRIIVIGFLKAAVLGALVAAGVFGILAGAPITVSLGILALLVSLGVAVSYLDRIGALPSGVDCSLVLWAHVVAFFGIMIEPFFRESLKEEVKDRRAWVNEQFEEAVKFYKESYPALKAEVERQIEGHRELVQQAEKLKLSSGDNEIKVQQYTQLLAELDKAHQYFTSLGTAS